MVCECESPNVQPIGIQVVSGLIFKHIRVSLSLNIVLRSLYKVLRSIPIIKFSNKGYIKNLKKGFSIPHNYTGTGQQMLSLDAA